jgi:hypothetical protein
MTFNRANFPPINETIESLILANRFLPAVKEYRIKHGFGIKDAKQVIEYERDRLLKDRSLSKETSDLLAHNVRNMLSSMVDTLANQLCVTRAHVLDHVVREAAKALEGEAKNG